MANPNELTNQLKSQSLGDVLASAFKQVGASVYPDRPALTDLMHFRNIVHSWAATHSPLYGNVVPDTGTAYSAVAVDTDTPVDLIAPANNEVVYVNAISVTNGGGAAPIVANIKLGDALLATATAGPSTQASVQLYNTLRLAKGQTLTITVISGTASDCTAHASAVKCSV